MKGQIFLKKYSSTILTVIGATGVIATSVLTAKATIKAVKLVESAEKEKESKLTAVEVVKAAWKPYIPAVITGISTITCIFGSNYLNKKTQASLISAYSILNTSYNEYRKKVREEYPEGSRLIERDVIESTIKNDINEEDDGKELFFDYQTMQYFRSTYEDVIQSEHLFNQNYITSGFAYLNDYCDIFGIPRVEYGYEMAWTADAGNSHCGYPEIIFTYEKVNMPGGMECWLMSTNEDPS